MSRRRLLIGLNTASAAIVLTLLAVRSAAQVWLIFAVMVWYGIQLVASDPAENALFAEMLPLDLRQRLNGWRLGLQETGRLVAPPVGAALFAVVGGGSVAAFDSVTFVVAALTITRLRLREPAPRARRATWRADLLAGLVHVRRTPALVRLLATGGFVIAASGLLVAAQYSLVQAIGEPPAFLGVLSACLGAGSIVASLVSSRLLRHVGEGGLAILGMINFAIGCALRSTGVLPLAVAGHPDPRLRPAVDLPGHPQPGPAAHPAGAAGPGVRGRVAGPVRPAGPAAGAGVAGHPVRDVPADPRGRRRPGPARGGGLPAVVPAGAERTPARAPEGTPGG